ncbi:hypothetical protein A2630_03145 [Candidatus Woesebacteria bacterium RIFCSPHIGHO2_01_FULL_44_10]|uniref:Polymerase nucleotidyl transferase domain-containing protein n=1 Tax=Candidatus Woesebacteria bacterium RIFCSPLOWO2_01_FULL_44_14 TaxID=1802525 RepID=A0A1F8BY38_9BACT|nr:MAG: hypothetical protein A2630_03145 [Candidatus Woesebacteria bacterium RIFCSPHIGHO2_01_FULL_44_10]OGM56410.1 MAG: hypothetical protein A3F62_01815 [Candidatus Woesebacteria bacterium RIFCSPHIGHO2_12_FULL_44_11]OGM68810.1 MAG: hypothetical protein A2975_00360 [Candidatus Woesebacteria bacterium RIFCSPLOWO2_01_FULL_44_14]
MAKNLNSVKLVISQNLNDLKDKYNISQIGIFGSVARGESDQASDIDLLVEFSKPISFFKFVDLEDRLSQVTGEKVDLVTKNALKPPIKDEILKQTIYV